MIKWTDLTKFIKANAGKSALAPFTGQDYRALFAFAALCDCYTAADDPARKHLIPAMRLTLQCMQESTRPLAKWAIPFSLDWSHTDPLWNELLPATKFCGQCGKDTVISCRRIVHLLDMRLGTRRTQRD